MRHVVVTCAEQTALVHRGPAALGPRLVVVYHPQDEVAVRHGDDVALVHLTMTETPPERPPWPATTFFESAEELDAYFGY